MEFISEVTRQITEQKFGKDTYVWNNGESSYTEEAQDFFNERYDEIETLYNTLIK